MNNTLVFFHGMLDPVENFLLFPGKYFCPPFQGREDPRTRINEYIPKRENTGEKIISIFTTMLNRSRRNLRPLPPVIAPRHLNLSRSFVAPLSRRNNFLLVAAINDGIKLKERKKERERNFSILNFVFVISREKYLSRFKAVTRATPRQFRIQSEFRRRRFLRESITPIPRE